MPSKKNAIKLCWSVYQQINDFSSFIYKFLIQYHEKKKVIERICDYYIEPILSYLLLFDQKIIFSILLFENYFKKKIFLYFNVMPFNFQTVLCDQYRRQYWKNLSSFHVVYVFSFRNGFKCNAVWMFVVVVTVVHFCLCIFLLLLM